MHYPGIPTNCLLWALAHRLLYGGSLVVMRSRRWRVCGVRMLHVGWRDCEGHVFDYRPVCQQDTAVPPMFFYGAVHRDGVLWVGQRCCDHLGV